MKIDSGEVQILNDNDIFIYPIIYENNNFTNNFIKFNIKDKTTTNISKSQDVNSLVHFNALNNKEILINGAIPKSNGELFKYYIDKHDTDKNIRKNIISSDFNIPNETGKLIISVSVNNNKIYVYSIESYQNNKKYLIEIYDYNGKIERSIHLNNFEKYIEDTNGDLDSVLKFKAFNNYFYFYTLNGKSILLEYKNNQLKEIPLGQTNTLELMDASTGNLNDSSSTIIYFLDRSSYMMYSLDLNNPKLKPLELKLDEPYKYITQCVADKDGSLIIKVSESKEANSYKYYHVYKIGK